MLCLLLNTSIVKDLIPLYQVTHGERRRIGVMGYIYPAVTQWFGLPVVEYSVRFDFVPTCSLPPFWMLIIKAVARPKQDARSSIETDHASFES